MKTLNVGAIGEDEKEFVVLTSANVNIDVKKPKKRKLENFLVADGQRLPFQNNVFDLVVASHVIEHVINPELMLHELIRVSSHKVLIHCPHRFSKYAKVKSKAHKVFLNKQWFRKILLKEPNVIFSLDDIGIPFFLEYNLRVEIWKCYSYIVQESSNCICVEQDDHNPY